MPRPHALHERSFVVRGGQTLGGEVPVSGYKHALIGAVAAAVATSTPVTFRNVPSMTTEYRVLRWILEGLGATSRLQDGTWELDPRPMACTQVPPEASALIHGSLDLVPALVARFGRVSVAHA